MTLQLCVFIKIFIHFFYLLKPFATSRHMTSHKNVSQGCPLYMTSLRISVSIDFYLKCVVVPSFYKEEQLYFLFAGKKTKPIQNGLYS